MADDIFVGSVSVGVVPDLKGFNTKLRAELVPSANRIGKEMGDAMTKGISENLGVTKVSLAKMRKSITDSMKDIKVEVGVDVSKVALDELKLKINKQLKDIKIFVNVDVSKVQLDLVRAKIIDGLSGIKVNVELGVTKVSIAKTRAEIRDGLKGINVGVNVGVGGVGGGRGGGGGRGAAAAAGGGGFIAGINALIRALPGGTAGSIGAVPAPILAGAGAVGLASLPFIGQILAGFVPLLGGGALAGLGVAGAFGPGGTTQAQVAQARAASQAANARVRAAQARLAGLSTTGTGPSALSRQSAQLGLEAAQQRLTQARGGTSAAAILSAEASVASAQDRINKLRTTGKASAAQLASAEAGLASARATQSKASQAYQQAQADQITKSQQAVRDSFKQLSQDAKTSLTQIGAPMAPVMKNILETVDSTIQKLTPTFTNAVKIISGPFGVFAHDIINTFDSPQVKSSITAIATAFADVMKAFTPDIPGIINSFADAIERIAKAVSKNPKAFADLLNFVFQFGIFILNTIAFLTDFANYIEQHFMPAMHDIAHIFDVVRHEVARQWDQMWQDTIGNAIRFQRHVEQLISDWLHNIAHWFDVARHWVATQWDQMWQDTVGRAIRTQRHLEQLISGWLHNVAHWFDLARHWVASAWDTLWDNTAGKAVKSWQWIYDHVWTPIKDFFTKTLPGWFDTAVKSVGTLWDNIKAKIASPIRWVAQHILVHLFNAIDDITKFVGLKEPLKNTVDALNSIPAKATGGKITHGTTGTADDVLIRASRGETVVSAAHSRMPFMQAAFAAAGVPGYAVGGLVNPVGSGAIPERVDMGVDYGGLFDLFAIGSGRITSIANSGWPGGTFIDLQLNPPYGSGYWYYAENIQPTVNIGDTVRAGQRVGIARGYGPGVEIGWASGRGGETAAARDGQAASHGDPGSVATAWGVAASNLIKSLGGPPGIISGKISGGTSGLGGIVRTIGDILGGIGRFASVAIDLAHGNVTKALSDMLGKIGGGTGGAGGMLTNVLARLPGNLAHKALSFLVDKVKGFVTSQQAAGYPGVPPASGSALAAQNFAKAHLAAFGWGPGQFPPLLALWQGESGWNANAVNKASGAYGIPQALGHGHPFNLGDYANQVMWGLNYIKGSYGSPAAAYSKWLSRSPHWYAKGTGSDGAAAGWAWVGEQGPELVNFHGGEMVMPHGDFGGYQSGTVSAAVSLANRNKAAAQAIANQNKATAAAIAAYNRMARAGASLVALIAKITPKTTASVFASDQAKFLADLRLYFTPSTAKYRSQLVIKQISEMENLQTHIKTLSTNIANASAFQKQELAHLQSTGGIGAIGIQGVGAAGGRSILAGLTRQLTDMRNFGYAIRDLSRAGASQAVLKTVAAMDPASGTIYARKMISALKKMHGLKLSPEMINQLIALGPDAALAYVNAIQAAGPSVLRQIKSTEAALAATTLGTSRGIAAVVSGGVYNTGANFVAGLKSQEKALEKQFAHLGRVLGEEAIKWMHVPPNRRPFGYQHGGWINEPISGYGAYTGSYYTFAEKGREYVLPEGQMAGSWRGVQGDSYHAHFDGLTGAAIESHVQTAFQAMSMQQGRLQRQGRRS